MVDPLSFGSSQGKDKICILTVPILHALEKSMNLVFPSLKTNLSSISDFCIETKPNCRLSKACFIVGAVE